jgi:hypothetical protein
MGRFRAASILLAALAAGILLAACGSNSGAELLPGTTADQINSNLDLVRESVNEENCDGAEEAVAQVSTEVDELQKVDKKLKAALKQGATKLSEVVEGCGASEEAEEEKIAGEQAEAEQEAFEAEEAEAEEQAFEKEQKAEERGDKEQEKAEKEAEQPEPPTEGEESGKGKGKESQEETVEPPVEEEEVTPPSEGGGNAGGIGPGAAVEGGH